MSARTTTEPALRKDNFDLLRLLVAVLVMARHSMGRLDIDKPVWWWLIDILPGVPIFFVVSGFLVSASWERRANLRSYAESRVRRIFPGLWLCVALTVGVAMWFGYDFAHPAGVVWGATQLVGLIYTPGFLDSFGSGTYNGALWTIPVSLQLYVLLPAFYLLLARTGTLNRGLVALWAAALALALILRPMIAQMEGENEPLDVKLLRYSFLPHLYLFLAGILLQRFRVHHSPFIQGKGLYWLAGYVALMYITPDSAVRTVLQPLAVSVVALSCAFTAGGLMRNVLRDNDVSYGVFIFHGLVINAFVELGLTGSPLHGLGVALVTFIIALIVLHLITMRIADFVVDSKIGPLDRTLGFVFGVARGVLIAVVLVVFGQWLLGPKLPPWAAQSRSLPTLADLGDSLIAALPPDLEQQVTDVLRRGVGGEDPNAPDSPPPEDLGTDALEDGTPPAPAA